MTKQLCRPSGAFSDKAVLSSRAVDPRGGWEKKKTKAVSVKEEGRRRRKIGFSSSTVVVWLKLAFVWTAVRVEQWWQEMRVMPHHDPPRPLGQKVTKKNKSMEFFDS